ncbi:unnamed protein product [Diatraea saccharalis]|uniref:Uncharacterized protein n=1 Tax=Diatraea saccharalis TaxID=40085 RepID=A0A9N9RDI8_9NEOP|nr:unnamed protein product [Diatraea saccharalis]
MFLLKSALRSIRSRGISTSSVVYDARSLAKLKKMQAEYQCEDGREIWLKAGFRDRLLYALTIICCYTGVMMTLSTVYDHAKPPSWKSKPC